MSLTQCPNCHRRCFTDAASCPNCLQTFQPGLLQASAVADEIALNAFKHERAIPQPVCDVGGSADVLPATSLLRPRRKLITRGH